MKVVHFNPDHKEDPIQEFARVLVAKWRRRDKANAEKIADRLIAKYEKETGKKYTNPS